MFFWLVAIPFFVIIAMFTLFKFPSGDLHKPEDIQDTAMAFRMAMQHDVAAKLMQEYQADSESDMFDEGSYDLGGDAWKETILDSGYLPSTFIPDTDNITTYIRCLNGLRQIASCRGAMGVYMVTAATPPSGDSITTRWFEKKGAVDLAAQLKKYEGSFPVKPKGLAIPKKPRKEEDESDEAFAIRLNEYKENKAKYELLKRNYYDFGNKLPHPFTTVGQVRAYPFNDENAESRVIVRRIREVEGDVVFDKEYLPTDLPTGVASSETMDFNGEAVILTASFKQPDPCVTDEDCFSGAPYCNAGICGTTKPCSSDADCTIASIPYCTAGMCAPFSAGTVVYEVNNITTASLSTPVAQVGTYTISTAGKYQIRLMGEASYRLDDNTRYHADDCAGGILIADIHYSAGTLITIKAISGGIYSVRIGGAGVALWNTTDTTGTPKLVAGGGGNGASVGGGGYLGGNARVAGASTAYRSGYGWNGITGGNGSYCTSSTNCSSIGATGGRWQLRSGNNYSNGGTGYCESGYNCTTIAGGNATFYPYQYSASTYGNWGTNELTGGLGYAAIVYCGPSASSACPASCGNNVSCTTGTCNYHTGLCQ